MPIDVGRFYRASNPSQPIADERYYVDCSSVRGGDIIRELERTIVVLSPEQATTQLFTGHIGSGKSTELFRLRSGLEAAGFHVVYFESDQDLEMGNIDITNIMLVMARRIAASLEAVKIQLRPSYFQTLLGEISRILNMPIEVSDVSFSMGIASITAKARESNELLSKLQNFLEPRTKSIIDAINQELIIPGTERLKQQGKKGLVVIVDNLDRIDSTRKVGDRTQPAYIFVDRGDQLKRLACHVIYTIPLSLVFSNEQPRLLNRFGIGLKVLPMVPVRDRQGNPFEPGLALMRQVILARAFPDFTQAERLERTEELFQPAAALDRLCDISGGHMRTLLRLLAGCLQRHNPPILQSTLETVIRDERDFLARIVEEPEWALLFRAVQQLSVQGDEDYNALLRNLLVYEYRDQIGQWFNANPLLTETEKFKIHQRYASQP
ncbi:MAG: AAA family ATPase [Leptolyngbyaceae cyanobacterium SL_1_1]|nr:AAA family ATPase [Leptolyngbyaceae cyanobacterium RM1_1_2]NJO09912.1 AAA family ATPase [Leptolyngbyaceae cyanobacterium SL_1_1]